MRIIRWHDFGPVRGLELGYAFIGSPYMTVFCWFVDDLMVDTGLAHGRAAVLEAVSERRLRAVALTHAHEDHTANAGAIRRQQGVPIYAHPITVARLRRRFRMLPYRHLVWGQIEPTDATPVPDRIAGAQVELEAIPTPGHTPDHVVYWAPALGALFSGDLYLGDRIKYFRRNEDYGQIMASLRRVLTLEVEMLCCAHRPHRSGGRQRLQTKLQFLEDLLGEVRRLHAQGLSPKQIASRQAWTGVRTVKWFTFGDASAENLIRAALRCVTDAEAPAPPG